MPELEIQTIREDIDGDVVGYYARGFVDKAEFAAALTEGWEHPTTPEDVRHERFHMVPHPDGGGFTFVRTFSDAPKRGATAVTHVVVEDW